MLKLSFLPAPLRTPMRLLLLFVCAAAFISFLQQGVDRLFSARNAHRVLITDLKDLDFYAGKLTTHRRHPARMQLECVNADPGVKFPASLMPSHVHCQNMGSMGGEVRWYCEGDLQKNIEFGNMDIVCEGWSGPKDPFVVEGSCGLRYELVEIVMPGRAPHYPHLTELPRMGLFGWLRNKIASRFILSFSILRFITRIMTPMLWMTLGGILSWIIIGIVSTPRSAQQQALHDFPKERGITIKSVLGWVLSFAIGRWFTWPFILANYGYRLWMYDRRRRMGKKDETGRPGMPRTDPTSISTGIPTSMRTRAGPILTPKSEWKTFNEGITAAE